MFLSKWRLIGKVKQVARRRQLRVELKAKSSPAAHDPQEVNSTAIQDLDAPDDVVPATPQAVGDPSAHHEKPEEAVQPDPESGEEIVAEDRPTAPPPMQQLPTPPPRRLFLAPPPRRLHLKPRRAKR